MLLNRNSVVESCRQSKLINFWAEQQQVGKIYYLLQVGGKEGGLFIGLLANGLCFGCQSCQRVARQNILRKTRAQIYGEFHREKGLSLVKVNKY